MSKRAIIWISEHHLTGVSILGLAIFLATALWVTRPQAAPRVTLEKSWPVSVLKSSPGALAPNLVAFGKVESLQVVFATSAEIDLGLG